MSVSKALVGFECFLIDFKQTSLEISVTQVMCVSYDPICDPAKILHQAIVTEETLEPVSHWWVWVRVVFNYGGANNKPQP